MQNTFRCLMIAGAAGALLGAIAAPFWISLPVDYPTPGLARRLEGAANVLPFAVFAGAALGAFQDARHSKGTFQILLFLAISALLLFACWFGACYFTATLRT